MSEIKKTLAIFKSRWPEVTLLIALFVINPALNMFRPHLKKPYDYVEIVFCFVYVLSLGLIIVTLILEYGFFRTVFLDESKPHSPATLLKLGSHFFWRMFAFGILIVILNFLLQWLISLPIAPYICPDTTFLQRIGKCPFLYAFQASVASLILIKLSLFIPALIFVLDCRLVESFGLLKHCRLSKATEPVFLYCFSIIFGMFFWAITTNLRENSPILYDFSMISQSVITSFLGLAIGTMTVRYAASLKLVYVETEIGPETENPEAPPES